MKGRALRKDRRRFALLRAMRVNRRPLWEIALRYGGTEQGVRSTIRKLRERGELPDRRSR